MICPNCKGEKIFKDLDCYCFPSDKSKPPKPDCGRCHGKGKYDVPCQLCDGSGEARTSFDFIFVNDENGHLVRFTVDISNLPPIKLRSERQNSIYPDKIERWWDVPLADLFEEKLAQIGAFKNTHFMYQDGRAIEWWNIVNDVTAGTNGAGHQPDPAPEKLMEQGRIAVVSHFGWYSKNGEAIVRHFRHRDPTEKLLEDLYKIVRQKGFAYKILTGEGIIATGETGWAVCLCDEEGNQFLAEIGLSYELAVALRQAIDAAPESIKQAKSRKRED